MYSDITYTEKPPVKENGKGKERSEEKKAGKGAEAQILGGPSGGPPLPIGLPPPIHGCVQLLISTRRR